MSFWRDLFREKPIFKPGSALSSLPAEVEQHRRPGDPVWGYAASLIQAVGLAVLVLKLIFDL